MAMKIVDDAINANRENLRLLGYSDKEIEVITSLMSFLCAAMSALGMRSEDIYHKNTVETLRGLANIIDIITQELKK